MEKHFFYYYYECAPIDHWNHWTCFFSQSSIPFSGLKIRPITPEFFLLIVEFISVISDLGFSGSIRSNSDIYYSGIVDPRYGISSFQVAVKDEINGTVYIGSNDRIRDDYLESLLDDKEDLKHVKLIHEVKP
jgi:hypothetical protein